MEMTKAVAILVLLLVSPTAYATDYIVGDGGGWTVGVNYTTWASNKNFTTDDTLLFNYGPPHTVDVVLVDGYNKCTANDTSSNKQGPTNITLNAPGTWYFICAAPGHCKSGQKLAINVMAGTGNSIPSSPAAPAPADGSVPSTPAPTSSGTPPSTATPKTPSAAVTLDGGNCLMVGLMSLVLMAIVGVVG